MQFICHLNQNIRREGTDLWHNVGGEFELFLNMGLSMGINWDLWYEHERRRWHDIYIQQVPEENSIVSAMIDSFLAKYYFWIRLFNSRVSLWFTNHNIFWHIVSKLCLLFEMDVMQRLLLIENCTAIFSQSHKTEKTKKYEIIWNKRTSSMFRLHIRSTFAAKRLSNSKR